MTWPQLLLPALVMLPLCKRALHYYDDPSDGHLIRGVATGVFAVLVLTIAWAGGFFGGGA